MADKAYLPLPVELEGLTPAWLTAALSDHAPGIEVRGFEVVDEMRTTCTKLRLRLDIAGPRGEPPVPDTVILKGGFEPHSRMMWNMHMTECLSYATLMPAFAMRTPQVWFSRWDESAKQGIVIMEDLALRGVEFCKPTQPQAFDAIAARLTELARLHAGTWDSPELREGGRWGWMSDTPERILDFMGPLLEADVWDSFVASPRGAAASTRFHDRYWMREAMEQTAVFARDLPRCACHGDTHLGNLYVDTDGTPGFFDCISYKAPGMYEVTYHLACALDLADRPAMERPLVQHYLDSLRGHGIAAPSLDEAMDQFAAFLAYGYLIFIVNDAVFQPEAYNTAYTARFSAAMLDHHTKERLAEVA